MKIYSLRGGRRTATGNSSFHFFSLHVATLEQHHMAMRWCFFFFCADNWGRCEVCLRRGKPSKVKDLRLSLRLRNGNNKCGDCSLLKLNCHGKDYPKNWVVHRGCWRRNDSIKRNFHNARRRSHQDDDQQTAIKMWNNKSVMLQRFREDFGVKCADEIDDSGALECHRWCHLTSCPSLVKKKDKKKFNFVMQMKENLQTTEKKTFA